MTLPGYGKYVVIPINHTDDGELTDFQVSIDIVKGSGTNSAGTIYLNNHALNWPYDIRFTDAGGELLDFWREEYDTTDGTWIINVPVIANSGTTDIYLYYGKPSDTDASDGPATFPDLFDDFAGAWNPTPVAGYVCENDDIEKSVNCPAVIKMPNGNLLCAFCSDDAPPNDLHNCIRGSIFDMGTQTWGPAFVIVDHAVDYSYGCAEVAFGLASDGKILLFYLKITQMLYNAKIHQIESSDNGASWGNDHEITTGHEYNNCCGNNNVVLTNGKRILPYSFNNSVYPTWDFRAACMISESGMGDDWVAGGVVPLGSAPQYGLLEPGICEATDGSLIMFMRTYEGHIWKSTSDDDGANWTAPVSTGIVASTSSVRMERVSMDPDRIHIIWNKVAPPTRHPLNIAELGSNGTVVLYEQVITNPAYDAAMGCEIVDGDDLYIIWWDRPNTTGNLDNIKYFKTSLQNWLRSPWGGDLASASVSDGVMTLTGDAKYLKSTRDLALPVVIETRARISAAGINNVAIGWGDTKDGLYAFPVKGVMYYTASPSQIYSKHGAGGAGFTSEKTPYAATLTDYEVLKFRATVEKTKVYYNDTLDVETQTSTTATIANPWFESRAGCNVLVDWVFARKHTANEPTWAAPGEETAIGNFYGVGLVGPGLVGRGLVS